MSNPEAPVLVRRSTIADAPALAALAAGCRRTTVCGVYLVAEVGRDVVAATPLEGRGATLHDPARETRDIRDLLDRWAENLRRHSTEIAEAA